MDRPIMARLHTRITPKQKEFLEQKAKADSRTEGATLRNLIDYYIKKNKKEYEHLRTICLTGGEVSGNRDTKGGVEK